MRVNVLCHTVLSKSSQNFKVHLKNVILENLGRILFLKVSGRVRNVLQTFITVGTIEVLYREKLMNICIFMEFISFFYPLMFH